MNPINQIKTEICLNEKNTEKLTELISKILGLLIKLHENFVSEYRPKIKDLTYSEKLNYFIGNTVPNLDMYKYIHRCIKYFKCEYVCHIHAVIYIDRLIKTRNNLFINENNYHRIYGIALLCACKYMEDDIFTNTYYAKIIGITLKELNSLEKIFLTNINYNLYITPKLFNEYSKTFPLSIFI